MFLSIIIIFIVSTTLLTLSFCKVAGKADQWEEKMFKEIKNETCIVHNKLTYNKFE